MVAHDPVCGDVCGCGEREGASAAYIVLRKRFLHMKGEVKNALITGTQLWKQVYLNAKSFS